MKGFSKSICAGAAIALGGTVFLACSNKIVGALLFSVGLLTVLVFGFDLFTGKACNEAFLKKPGKLVLIWLGNLIGAVLFGLMISIHTDLQTTAAGVVAAKLDKSFLMVVVDGIICEFCIAIAVRGYAKAEGVGRYLAVVLGVMVFILCGAEHVVADMFYFAAGHANLANADLYLFFLAATLGNTLGGVLWWLGEKLTSKQ
jgi:formate/nitrite transporter FocA (FNT family)